MRRGAAAALGLALGCAPGDDVQPRSTHLVAEEATPMAIATALQARTEGTYLPELLEMRAGWSYRWSDRRVEPMRVWIEPSRLPTYRTEFARAAEQAFNDWAAIGLPFAFTFVRDSARADVHLSWVDRFRERMTGRTLWHHDQHGWIVSGSIELALHLPDGRPVALDGVRAIALHEVGHLIGLDHPSDQGSVMAAQVFVTQMNEADRRTARLIYDLPPGPIRP